jgi:tetratricopeptide (TPR) repeat protein
MRNHTRCSRRGRGGPPPAVAVAAVLAVGAMVLGVGPRAAVAQSEAEVSALYQRSYDREALGDYGSALDALTAMPRAEQGGFIHQLRRGWLLYLLGRYEESIAAYEAAVRTAPEALEAKLGLMLPQMAVRRWQDAERTGREVLEVDALSFLARRRVALALYNLGRYAEAEALYREVLVQYPSDVEVLSGVAWSRYQQGDVEEARRLFREVLHYSQNNASAIEGLRAVESP